MTVAKKQSNGRKKKAWHITDFRELFELNDDIRKGRPGPLTYTKSVVTVSGLSKEAEVRHFERMRVLKARQERHLLRSVFEDLKNWTASKHFGPRGYLVTTDNKPANYEYLAAQLEQMNVEELKQAMPLLEDIGLIERVSMNGSFKPDEPVRSKPDSSGRKRKALKKDKDKNKNKSNTKSKNKNKFGNGNTKRKRNTNRQKRGKDNSKSLKGQSKREDKATTASPATTPPIMSQTADARGSRVIPFNPAPSGSVEQRGAQRIGQIAQGMVHRYDIDAKQFAGEIYQALAIPVRPDSEQGRRELGSFASLWTGAKRAGIGAEALGELWGRAVEEACKIAKRGRKCKNAAAVWCTVFKRLLAARRSGARCKVM